MGSEGEVFSCVSRQVGGALALRLGMEGREGGYWNRARRKGEKTEISITSISPKAIKKMEEGEGSLERKKKWDHSD